MNERILRSKGEGFYEGNVPAEEVERLSSYDYPNTISRKFLPDRLDGKTVLDVGSGSSSALQKMIEERGGSYVALEKNSDLLHARPSYGKQVQGDARQMPFVHDGSTKKIDVAHCRFVLMHLSAEDRLRVIQEINRIANEAVFLEYDWGSWEKRLKEDMITYADRPEFQKSLALQKRFIENSKALGETAGAEMNMGEKLKEEVQGVVGKPIRETRIERVPGDYYNDMVLVGTKANIPMWRKLKNEKGATEMEDIVQEITSLDAKERAPFQWTDIVGVTW